MKLPVRGNLSITSKIAASLGILIAFLMVTLGFFTAMNLKNTVQAGEEEKGRYMSEVLMARVAGPLAAADQAAVRQTLRDFLAESGMQGALVVNAEGKIVAAEGITRATSMMGDLNDFDGSGFKTKYVQEQNGTDPAFLFIRSIKNSQGQVAGYLGISTTAGYLQENMRSLVTYLGLVTVVAVIAGIFLAMIISRRILNRPIQDLSAATEHIATGDFSMKVNTVNRDELGNLASSFNMMTGYLANLFRSITTYTGELVKSCQSLSSAVKSTENASRRLVKSMQEHAGRTGEHISMLQGCADLAGGLVERVEQSGRELRRTAGEIMAVAGDAREPARLMSGAEKSVDGLKHSLQELKQTAGSSLAAFGEMKTVAGVFAEYLDRSRDINFNLALEVARLGGRDLTGELDQLRQMADEGMEKTRSYIEGINNAGRSVDMVIKALEDNLVAVEKSKQAIAGAGACWESLGERLVSESEAIEDLMESLAENERQKTRLLEALGYLMEELDKALREFNGTGEAGEKQTELLGQLDSTMRRILRVSNALNNLCLQFRI